MIIIRAKHNEQELEEKLLKLLEREHIDAEQFSFSSQYKMDFHGITIDGTSQQVLRDGKQIPLTRLEFQLLLFLASHTDRVFSKEELFCAVWGKDSEDSIKVVPNTISNLRKKIKGSSEGNGHIYTVQGGYVFTDKVDSVPLP